MSISLLSGRGRSATWGVAKKIGNEYYPVVETERAPSPTVWQ